jgi:hypothetical protein
MAGARGTTVLQVVSARGIVGRATLIAIHGDIWFVEPWQSSWSNGKAKATSRFHGDRAW